VQDNVVLRFSLNVPTERAAGEESELIGNKRLGAEWVVVGPFRSKQSDAAARRPVAEGLVLFRPAGTVRLFKATPNYFRHVPNPQGARNPTSQRLALGPQRKSQQHIEFRILVHPRRVNPQNFVNLSPSARIQAVH
jgi:hypothetical protein